MNKEIEQILDNYKLINKITINIKDKDHFFDYIIIATCMSSKYMQKVTLDFTSKMKRNHKATSYIEGLKKCKWIVINCINYSIHFFLEEERIKYNIEELW